MNKEREMLELAESLKMVAGEPSQDVALYYDDYIQELSPQERELLLAAEPVETKEEPEEELIIQYIEVIKCLISKIDFEGIKKEWIILAIICSPFIVCLGAILLALVILGVLVTLSCAIAVVVLAFAGSVGGLASMGIGLVGLLFDIPIGLALIGLGVVCMGAGFVFMASTLWGSNHIVPRAKSWCKAVWTYLTKEKSMLRI